MFPILPALILLLLQGPSNMERLVREGRLPAALDAIHRDLNRSEGVRSLRSEAVIASILGSNDAHLSNAILALLAPEPAEDSAAPRELGVARVAIGGETPSHLSDGFRKGSRTRDGPF